MIEIIPNWHPILVHFTIALLSLAVLFSILVAFLPEGSLKGEWNIVARWHIWLGAVFAVATALSGWYAFSSVAHDEPSHIAMTDHRNWAIVTLSVFVILAAWSIWSVRKQRRTGALFTVILVAGGVLLLSTAWRGGELVYRHGLGVMSLPQAEAGEEGHDHDHGNAHHEAAPSSPNPGAENMPQVSAPEQEAMPAMPTTLPAAEPGKTIKQAKTVKPHNHDGHSHHD